MTTTTQDEARETPRACWCGEPNPHFDDDDLSPTCGGTGYLDCLCGGDFCVCHHHGEVECGGCEDCAAPDSEEALWGV